MTDAVPTVLQVRQGSAPVPHRVEVPATHLAARASDLTVGARVGLRSNGVRT